MRVDEATTAEEIEATGTTVGGHVNPVYFTATAMIGMIAGKNVSRR